MKLESPEVRKLRLDETILSSDLTWGVSIDRGELDKMSAKELRVWKDRAAGEWLPVNPVYVGWTRRRLSNGDPLQLNLRFTSDVDVRRFIDPDKPGKPWNIS